MISLELYFFRNTNRFICRDDLAVEDAAQHPSDVNVRREFADSGYLFAVRQCADDHPRDFLADTHPIQAVEDLGRCLLLPDLASVALVVINDRLADSPDTLVCCREAVQLITAEDCRSVPLANLYDGSPKIRRIVKGLFCKPLGASPYLSRLHLVVKDAGKHEFVGGSFAIEIGQPRPTDASLGPFVKKQFADALMFVEGHECAGRVDC